MWNANSQGGLSTYSLRNQRAYSRRTLGAVTTDIPLSRQRSRSGRQLRNQPGCSLSRRRSTNSRGSATMQMRVVVFPNRSRQRQRERAKGKRKHPAEFRRTGSHHPEWVREFRRRSRKLWIVVCVSASRTIPERRYRFLGNYRHLACLTLPSRWHHRYANIKFPRITPASKCQISRCSSKGKKERKRESELLNDILLEKIKKNLYLIKINLDSIYN